RRQEVVTRREQLPELHEGGAEPFEVLGQLLGLVRVALRPVLVTEGELAEPRLGPEVRTTVTPRQPRQVPVPDRTRAVGRGLCGTHGFGTFRAGGRALGEPSGRPPHRCPLRGLLKRAAGATPEG